MVTTNIEYFFLGALEPFFWIPRMTFSGNIILKLLMGTSQLGTKTYDNQALSLQNSISM